MNKIPKHWQKSKFEDVLKYEQPSKYIVKSTEYSDEYKTPVLTAGKSFILGYTDEKDGIFTDVPVIIFDDFTTDTKFVDFHFKVKSSAMKILKPTHNTNIKFIFYLMQTIHHKSDTHKRYWISEYAKREIPLPPLDEQNLIVKKIESCFEKIDFAISNFKKSKELIEIYKQSVLSHAFSGKLTNSNLNSWQVKKLGEICEILDNKRKPINSSEREMRLNLSTQRFPYFGATGQVGFIDDYIFDFEAILLGEDGAPFLDFFKNKAYIVSGKYWVNNHAHILKAINGISTNYFICYFLNSINYAPYVSGTTRLKLNQESMKNIKIPLPALSEQNLIVSEIEKRFKAADSALNLIEQNLKKAEILKQSILSKAFNGRLVKDKNE